MKTAHKNKTIAFQPRASIYVLGSTTLATLFIVNAAFANPTGGVVTAGTAAIVPVTAQQLDINQSTDKAIINWGSFNIGNGETTNFNQPGASSVTLNRIGGNNPSQILGNLNANGQVMLVNPNGTFFGNNAQVNVGSLLATSANITDANFLAGKYAFGAAGKNNAQVTNNGHITAADGGYVALVAPTATNNGTITANLGKVALAGADVFTLDTVGDKLINFALPADVARSGPNGASAGANNSGNIYADGGKVQLTAKGATTAIDGIVNMSGYIQAQSIGSKKGSVFLSGNKTNMSGIIDASGQGNANGGAITVEGKKTVGFTGSAKAEGGSTGGNGGTLLVKGNNMSLGGTASVGAPAASGKGGEATFQTGNILNINTPEAYTIGSTVAHGGTVNVKANNTINLNQDIDSALYGTPPAKTAAVKAKKGGFPDALNFGDGNNNGDLTINLKKDIKVSDGVALIGDGTQVNVLNDEASIQDGVDVASTAGADVAVSDGYYAENVNVYKNDINLHGVGGYYPASFTEGDGGEYGKPVIDGYVNVTADNDSVSNFKIKGASLNGEVVGVNGEGAGNLSIYDNHIALGEEPEWSGDELAALNVPAPVGTGIKLNDTPNAYVASNAIEGAITGVSVNDGINSEISCNDVAAVGTGVKVTNSSNVGVYGNNLSGKSPNLETASLLDEGDFDGGSIGVNASNAANLDVIGNTITHYETAIKLKDSANADVAYNTMTNVLNGVNGDNADNLVYDHNSVNGEGEDQGDALLLKDSSNATVTNNNHTDIKNKLRLINSNTWVRSGNNF